MMFYCEVIGCHLCELELACSKVIGCHFCLEQVTSSMNIISTTCLVPSMNIFGSFLERNNTWFFLLLASFCLGWAMFLLNMVLHIRRSVSALILLPV